MSTSTKFVLSEEVKKEEGQSQYLVVDKSFSTV
jgi:hypothetical protein